MEKADNGNVAAAIMMKVPTHNLENLRDRFLRGGEDGLDLVQFLEAFVRNMVLDSDDMLLRTVPDLIDFFSLVDIDGNGGMSWTEFVMFVIEQVVEEKDYSINERLKDVGQFRIQGPGCRFDVRCAKNFPEFNKLFIGVGSQVQIYDTDKNSVSWLSEPIALELKPKPVKDNKDNGNVTATSGRVRADLEPTNIEALDVAYMGSKDILFVLRTDLCIEFHSFISRAQFSSETVASCGHWVFKQPKSKLLIRDVPHMTTRLFMLGNSNKIESWLIKVSEGSSLIDFTDLQTLEMHKDLVRDILIINTRLYQFFVSCGLDNKVILWDLETLKFKCTRSGHTAGVQCLAFDGQSMLLAGGFDQTIIAWDLDAEITKPLFTLVGHKGLVTKVVALGDLNRILSLDENGVMKYWDGDKHNPNDKEERLIDSVECPTDRLNTFELFTNAGPGFNSAHGIIIAAQGHKQHIYRLTDEGYRESAPLSVLFSPSLLSIVSLHSKDIIFWSGVDGSELFKLGKAFVAPGAEATAATLDHRGRKLLVGDSAGTITVYNCVNGHVVRVLPPMLNSVRFMTYTVDKTVVAVSAGGDLCVFDEDQEDKPKDVFVKLREARGHDGDIVAFAFSRRLGLIATADTNGTLIIWSYEYFIVETIIRKWPRGEGISQIAFLDPLPLLLIINNIGQMSTITVGLSLQTFGRKLWHLGLEIGTTENFSVVSELTQTSSFHDGLEAESDADADADVDVVERMGTGSEFASPVNLTGSSASSPALNADLNSPAAAAAGSGSVRSLRSVSPPSRSRSRRRRGVSTVADDGDEEGGGHEKIEGDAVETGVQFEGDNQDDQAFNDDEGEGEDEEDGNEDEDDVVISLPSETTQAGKPKIFSQRRMREYMASRREPRSLAVHMTSSTVPLFEVSEDPIKATIRDVLSKRRAENEKDDGWGAAVPKVDLRSAGAGNDDDASVSASAVEASRSNYRTCSFQYGVRMEIIVGHDDGTIARIDLTPALKAIDVAVIPSELESQKSRGFDPRRVLQKTMGYVEAKRSTWSADDLRSLTVGVDHSSVSRHATRKAKKDFFTNPMYGVDEQGFKLFGTSCLRRVWQAHTSPVNSLSIIGESCDVLSSSEDLAVLLWTLAGQLKGVLTRGREFDALFKPRWRPPVDMRVRSQRRMDDARMAVEELQLKRNNEVPTRRRRAVMTTNAVPPVATPSSSRDQGSKYATPEKGSRGAGGTIVNSSSHGAPSFPTEGRKSSYMSPSPQGRVVEMEFEADRIRVIGQLNGHVTYQMSKKEIAHSALAQKHEAQQQRGRSRSRGAVQKARIVQAMRRAVGFDPFTDPAYMKDLMSDSDVKTSSGRKKKRVATKYDLELAAIDAKDEHNWEIQSLNRQRQMYNNLFSEIEKFGKQTEDRTDEIFASKLDSLAPGGNFRDFVRKLRVSRLKKLRVYDEDNMRQLTMTMTMGTGTSLPVADSVPRGPIVAEQEGEGEGKGGIGADLMPHRQRGVAFIMPACATIHSHANIMHSDGAQSHILESQKEDDEGDGSGDYDNNDDGQDGEAGRVVEVAAKTVLKCDEIQTETTKQGRDKAVIAGLLKEPELFLIGGEDHFYASLRRSTRLGPDKVQQLETPTMSRTSPQRVPAPPPSRRLLQQRAASVPLFPAIPSAQPRDGQNGNLMAHEGGGADGSVDSEHSLLSMASSSLSLPNANISVSSHGSKREHGQTIVKFKQVNCDRLAKFLVPSHELETDSGIIYSKIEERERARAKKATNDVVSKFESILKEAEATAKQARKKHRQEKRIAMQETKTRVAEAIANEAVLLPRNASSPKALSRHRSAAILISKSSNVDNIMEVTRKREEVERTVERKIKFIQGSAATEEEDTKRVKTPVQAVKVVATSLASSKSRDQMLLGKKTLGSYLAADILAVYRVFEYMDQVMRFEVVAVPVKAPRNLATEDTTMTTTTGGEAQAYEDVDQQGGAKNGEGGTKEMGTASSTRVSTAATGSAPATAPGTAEGAGVADDDWGDLDEILNAGLQSQVTRRASTMQISDTKEKVKPQEQQQQFVTKKIPTVNLSKFVRKKYFRSNPLFRELVQRMLMKRLIDDVKEESIFVSLDEILDEVFPLLSSIERKEAQRYLELKAVKRIKLEKEQQAPIVEELTEAQQANIKTLFAFFDKENTGLINRKEVSEVLKNLFMSTKDAQDDAKSAVIGDEGAMELAKTADMNEESVSAIIGKSDKEEINFDEFVELFRDLM